MNSQRLPAKAYARQLDRMRTDLDSWYASYRHAATNVTNDWLNARFEDRAATLAEIMRHLVEAETLLYDLPRLS